MHEYWLANGPGGTIHVSNGHPDDERGGCHSARRCNRLVLVKSTLPPHGVWDLLWHNHHTQAGVLPAEELTARYGTEEPLPVLGEAEYGGWMVLQPGYENRLVMQDGLAGLPLGVESQAGYGVSKWGCLHCLEPAAIAAGWKNSWPPDPNRRHK